METLAGLDEAAALASLSAAAWRLNSSPANWR